jgi:hypothetical protein
MRTNSDLCHLNPKLIGFITEMRNVCNAVRIGVLNKALCDSLLILYYWQQMSLNKHTYPVNKGVSVTACPHSTGRSFLGVSFITRPVAY